VFYSNQEKFCPGLDFFCVELIDPGERALFGAHVALLGTAISECKACYTVARDEPLSMFANLAIIEYIMPLFK